MYVDVFPPQATTFTITGLNAETPYNFSVNALNLLGESDYADGNAVLTVTTRGERAGTETTWAGLTMMEKYHSQQNRSVKRETGNRDGCRYFHNST